MNLASEPELKPFIRVGHFYEFPPNRNERESPRFGYCYAFHLVHAGKGRVSLPGGSIAVKKGDLLFFPPGVQHAFYSNQEYPLSTYNIYSELWTDQPLRTHTHLVWEASEYDPQLKTKTNPGSAIDALPPYFPLQHKEAMIEIFAHAVRHHMKHESYSELIAGSLLKAFIVEFVQISNERAVIDQRIQPILDQINQKAASGCRYSVWLAQTGLRKTHFHELFKKATGLSPKAYWTKIIMKQASIYLQESNHSVTEIARYLSYESIHHFSKQFTIYYGVSPTEYRDRKRVQTIVQ